MLPVLQSSLHDGSNGLRLPSILPSASSSVNEDAETLLFSELLSIKSNMRSLLIEFFLISWLIFNYFLVKSSKLSFISLPMSFLFDIELSCYDSFFALSFNVLLMAS